MHIVVLDPGFGSRTFCKQLQVPDSRISLVDRTNDHRLRPLLYRTAIFWIGK